MWREIVALGLGLLGLGALAWLGVLALGTGDPMAVVLVIAVPVLFGCAGVAARYDGAAAAERRRVRREAQALVAAQQTPPVAADGRVRLPNLPRDTR